MKQESDPALRPAPTKVIVETTTRCNLECAMCLRNQEPRALPEADMSLETFSALLPAVAQAEVLVLNGIGEPLLHPRLEEFIRLARTRMPAGGWIGFQSNGSGLDKERARALIDAGLDRICLSLDAVDPEGFRLIRRGGELSGIIGAIDTLVSARRTTNPALRIGIEFVLRRDNLSALPATIEMAGSLGVDFALVTHLFPYHPALVAQTVYDANLDTAVAVFREYSRQAAAEGVDLRRYPDVYMRFEKSAADRRVVELVQAMTTAAARRGVTVNLPKLLAMEEEREARCAAAFTAARDAAAEYGMDLRLPGITPRSARSCEFVEEGCTFVSVDGGVHPCYFLWHSCLCYINGIEKAVAPRSFGSVSNRGILDIWNDPEYVTFRRHVRRYDYPFCFNCNFALCDYVQGADFTQDCYINGEPCAVCLWCMEIFQCLK